MKNIKDYHDFYLEVDVLSLLCLFETFRNESINYFELDHAHYLSTPGYSWDLMFSFTKINLRLILDTEKYHFTESPIRGGISII